jgi:hypothetical protein
MKKGIIIGFVIMGLALGFSCKNTNVPEVKKPPTVESFTADPSTIHRGDTVMLSWSVKDATSVSIDQGVGTVSATGTRQVTPQDTTTYKLTATNDDGSRTATCTVTIELVLPTIDYFLANPTSIRDDESSMISWSVQNATGITIDQGIGTVSATGTRQVSPQATTNYTLTATNADGQNTATCQVEIKERAVLSVEIDLATASVVYHGDTNTTDISFDAVLTESNGVGGEADTVIVGTFVDEDTVLGAWGFAGGLFSAFGTLRRYCEMTSPGEPNLLLLYSTGTDDNTYIWEAAEVYTIYWSTPAKASVQFLRTLDPSRDARMIRALTGVRRIRR